MTKRVAKEIEQLRVDNSLHSHMKLERKHSHNEERWWRLKKGTNLNRIGHERDREGE